MSWLQKAAPERQKLRPPRRVSAMDSNVPSLSPPQCTGNFWLPIEPDRAKTTALPLP